MEKIRVGRVTAYYNPGRRPLSVSEEIENEVSRVAAMQLFDRERGVSFLSDEDKRLIAGSVDCSTRANIEDAIIMAHISVSNVDEVMVLKFPEETKLHHVKAFLDGMKITEIAMYSTSAIVYCESINQVRGFMVNHAKEVDPEWKDRELQSPLSRRQKKNAKRRGLYDFNNIEAIQGEQRRRRWLPDGKDMFDKKCAEVENIITAREACRLRHILIDDQMPVESVPPFDPMEWFKVRSPCEYLDLGGITSNMRGIQHIGRIDATSVYVNDSWAMCVFDDDELKLVQLRGFWHSMVRQGLLGANLQRQQCTGWVVYDDFRRKLVMLLRHKDVQWSRSHYLQILDKNEKFQTVPSIIPDTWESDWERIIDDGVSSVRKKIINLQGGSTSKETDPDSSKTSNLLSSIKKVGLASDKISAILDKIEKKAKSIVDLCCNEYVKIGLACVIAIAVGYVILTLVRKFLTLIGADFIADLICPDICKKLNKSTDKKKLICSICMRVLHILIRVMGLGVLAKISYDLIEKVLPEYESDSTAELHSISDLRATASKFADMDFDSDEEDIYVQAGSNDSSFSLPVVPLISVITGTIVGAQAPTPSVCKKIMMGVVATTQVAAAGSIVRTLIVSVQDYLPEILRSWVIAIFGIPPGSATSDRDIIEWVTCAYTEIETVNRNSNVLSMDKEISSRIESLYYQAPLISKRAETLKASRSELTQLRDLTRELGVICKTIWALKGETTLRQVPAVVYFYGASHIGKSTSLRKFCKSVLNVQEDDIYCRNVADDFWSGYHQQSAVIYDDFAATDGPSEAQEIMSCVTPNRFCPNMASVDDVSMGKKGDPFTSKLICLASNVSPSVEYCNISMPEALKNRFHICLHVRLLKGYTKVVDSKTVINWDKVRQNTTAYNPSPHLAYTLINPFDGKIINDSAGRPLVYDFPQVVMLARLKVKKLKMDFMSSMGDVQEKPFGYSSWLSEKQTRTLITRYNFIREIKRGSIVFDLPGGLEQALHDLSIEKMLQTVSTLYAGEYQSSVRNTSLTKLFRAAELDSDVRLLLTNTDREVADIKSESVVIHKEKLELDVDDEKDVYQVLGIEVDSKGKIVAKHSALCSYLDLKTHDALDSKIEVLNIETKTIQPPKDTNPMAKTYSQNPIPVSVQMNINGDTGARPKVRYVKNDFAPDYMKELPQPKSDSSVFGKFKKTRERAQELFNRYRNSKQIQHVEVEKLVDDDRLVDIVACDNYNSTLLSLIDEGVPDSANIKLEKDPYHEITPEERHVFYENKEKVKVTVQSKIKEWFESVKAKIRAWWDGLPKVVKGALTFLAACAAFVSVALMIWWAFTNLLGYSIPISLQKSHGEEKQQMLKLISLITKDIAEDLNKMNFEQLRHVLTLRLEECGYDPYNHPSLATLLQGTTSVAPTRQLYLSHLFRVLTCLDDDSRSNLSPDIFSVTNATPPELIKRALDETVLSLNTMQGDDVEDALLVGRMGSRILEIVDPIDAEVTDLESLRPDGFQIPVVAQSNGKQSRNTHSKASRKWSNTHKAAISRIKAGRKFKFIKSSRRVNVQMKRNADEVECVRLENVNKGFSIGGMPLGHHVLGLPRHFFATAEKGDMCILTWRTVRYSFRFDPNRVIEYKYKTGVVSEFVGYVLPDYFPCFPNQCEMFINQNHVPIVKGVSNILAHSFVGKTGDALKTIFVPDATYNPSHWIMKMTKTGIKTGIEGMIDLPGSPLNDGDCGLPYVWKRLECSKILAVHFATTLKDNTCSEGMIVTKEIVTSIMNYAANKFSCPVEKYEADSFNRDAKQFRTFEPVENKETTENPRLTDFRRSPIATPDYVKTDDFAPAPLSSQDPRIVWKDSPFDKETPLLKNVISKYDVDLLPYPEDAREFARNAQFVQYASIPVDKKIIRELSWEEAVNGLGHMKSVSMDTSPGEYWTKRGFSTRKQMFDSVDGVYVPKRELRERMEYIYKQFEKGEVPDVLWKDVLKDELRTKEKVAQGKTRSFCVMDTALLIVVRKILGSLMSFRNSIYDTTSNMIGMNPYSPDWDTMIKRLKSVGESGFDVDWKSYEAGVGSEEWYDDSLIAHDWYKLHGEHNPLFHRLIDMAYYSMSHRKVKNGGMVYVIHQANGSGGPKTSQINTATNDRRLAMAYYTLAPKPMNTSITQYYLNVAAAFYGDDGMIVVSDKLQKYLNPNDVVKFHARYGRTMTSADKLSDVVWKEIEDLEFLSRKTVCVVRSNGEIEYRAEPKETILDKISNWVRVSDVMGAKENVVFRCESYLWQCCAMERDEYYRFVNDMMRVLYDKIPDAVKIIRVPAYEDIQEAYENREIDEEDVGQLLLPKKVSAQHKEEESIVGEIKSFVLESLPSLYLLAQSSESNEMILTPSTDLGVGESSGAVVNEKGTKLLEAQETVSTSPHTKNLVKSTTDPGLSIEDLSSRFIRLKTVQWSITDVPGTVLWRAVIPWDLLISPTIRTPFEKFVFVNCEAEIKFMITGTQFHSGCVRAYRVPLLNNPDSNLDYAMDRAAQSSVDGLYLYPDSPGTMTLKIPYIHPKDMLNVTHSNRDHECLGTVQLAVFNALHVEPVENLYPGNTDTVWITIFVRFTKIHFAVPRFENSIPGHTQMGQVSSKVVNVSVKGNSNTIPTEIAGDELDNRVEAGNAMDNITLNMSPPPLIRRALGPFSYSEGVEYADKLSLHPSVMTPSHMSDFGETVDTMSIPYLTSKETYCDTFTWKTSDTAESLIASGLISPTDCLRFSQSKRANDVPLISFVSRPFVMWSGGLIRTFMIACSKMHMGALIVTVHYGRTTMPDNLDLAQREYFVEFTLDGNHREFTIEIPYQSDTPQKFVNNGLDGNDREVIGVWGVWVLNPLRAPGVAFNSVEINTFVAGMPDFKLSYLNFNGSSLVQRMEGRVQSDRPTETIGVRSAPVQPHYPEVYDSLRDIAKRFVLIDRIDIPATGDALRKYKCTGQYKMSDLFSKILFPWNLMYGACKGTLTMRLTGLDSTEIKVFFVPGLVKLKDVGNIEKWCNGELMNPHPIACAVTNTTVQFIDFQIPFVTIYKMVRLLPGSEISSKHSQVCVGSVVLLTKNIADSSKGNFNIDVYIAGGDDFRMGVFLGVPRVITDPKMAIIPEDIELDQRIPGYIIFDYRSFYDKKIATVLSAELSNGILVEQYDLAALPNPNYKLDPRVSRVLVDTTNLLAKDLVSIGMIPDEKTKYERDDGWTLVITGMNHPLLVFSKDTDPPYVRGTGGQIVAHKSLGSQIRRPSAQGAKITPYGADVGYQFTSTQGKSLQAFTKLQANAEAANEIIRYQNLPTEFNFCSNIEKQLYLTSATQDTDGTIIYHELYNLGSLFGMAYLPEIKTYNPDTLWDAPSFPIT